MGEQRWVALEHFTTNFALGYDFLALMDKGDVCFNASLLDNLPAEMTRHFCFFTLIVALSVFFEHELGGKAFTTDLTRELHAYMFLRLMLYSLQFMLEI